MHFVQEKPSICNYATPSTRPYSSRIFTSNVHPYPHPYLHPLPSPSLLNLSFFTPIYNTTANNPSSAAATPISILPAAPVDCSMLPVEVLRAPVTDGLSVRPVAEGEVELPADPPTMLPAVPVALLPDAVREAEPETDAVAEAEPEDLGMSVAFASHVSTHLPPISPHLPSSPLTPSNTPQRTSGTYKP
jgi:hypothetical protein